MVCVTCAEKDQTVKERVKEFCNETSAHALGQTVRTGNKIRALFWSIVFIGACVGCTWNIVRVVSDYLTYSHSIKSREVFIPSNLSFPSVTICNLNPLSSTKLSENQHKFERSLGLLDSTCDNEFNRSSSERPFILDIFRGHSLPKYWFEYNSSVSDVLGHSKNDFIVDCSFQEIPGCEQYFSVTKDPTLFNCFTFNPPKDILMQTGLAWGLSLTLFLEDLDPTGNTGNDFTQFNSYTYGDVGVKVIVHNPGSHPNPSTGGETAEVGTTTNFVLKQVIRDNLGPPKPSPCNPQKYINDNSNDYLYSGELCVALCLQKALVKNCGCTLIDDVIDKLSFQDVPYCGSYPCNTTKVIENYRCLNETVMKYLFNDIPDCSYCTDSCDDVIYETRSFQSKWPSALFRKGVLKWLDEKPPNRLYSQRLNKTSSENKQAFLENNFLRLNFYFTDYNIRVDTETFDLDWFGLLSNVGGAFGFWVGVSVVTGVEALELFLDMIFMFFAWFTGKKRTVSLQDGETNGAVVMDAYDK